jgi:hypothetical protein
MKSVLEAGYKSNLLIVEFNPLWNNEESYTKRYIEFARKGDFETDGSSNYGASLRCFVNLLTKYDYRLIHVMKNNRHGDVSCNNAFFIQSKFDIENRFSNQEEVIKQLFPISFVESFKKEKNLKKFKTNNPDEIKTILKKEWFLEI